MGKPVFLHVGATAPTSGESGGTLLWQDTSTADKRIKFYDGASWVEITANDPEAGGGGGGAPTTADYLVKTADAGLSAERVVTDNTEITWDWGTAGVVKAVLGAFTGDVTRSVGSLATTIANLAVTTAKIAANAVTFAKFVQASATSKIVGRKSASGGDFEECSLSEVLDMIGSAAQGDVLYRGAATWARLGAGTSGNFLQTQGAGANPQWAAASGGSIEVLRKRVVLTDAQIKSLNTSPVTAIAAPGAGKMISVMSVWLVKDSSAGAYSSASSIRLRWNGIVTDLMTAASMNLANANKTIARFGQAAIASVAINPFNVAVEISSSADVTGGNAANYLLLDIEYIVTTDGP